MTRSQVETWSIWRALALLAATFAVVLGSLLPFAALAASTPGQPIVICSAEGPKTIATGVDGEHGGSQGMAGAECAACILILAADLPTPPIMERGAVPTTRPAATFVIQHTAAPPPARGPPRPHSTAPPQT